MSLLGLDHIVIMVPDLGAAMRDYAELGFAVVAGGSHPTGTHNALIAFLDGTYIELIAFERVNPEHRWWQAAQNGGGLIDFCMRTNDLGADVAAFRRRGVELQISPGERVRPDGYRLRWTLAQPQTPYNFILPFLIEDVTPRDQRVPHNHRHPNGASGIVTLTIAARDLALPRDWWSAAMPKQMQDVYRPELVARGTAFTVGPQGFELLAPEATASPLSPWLATRGSSPWSVTLKTLGQQDTLDERKARSRVILVH